MKIGFLGAGSWGFSLAFLLASNGHEVVSWTTKKELSDSLNAGKEHPHLKGHKKHENMHFTLDMQEALQDIDLLVESVTSAGIRPVFEKVKPYHIKCPIVLTSKGIEQNSGLILPDVVIEVLGDDAKNQVGVLSGPSFALDVIKGLPTSVVASAYNADIIKEFADAFNNQYFRVYPNQDIHGVSYGGALKNIIAIACGVCEGLSLGASAKAALITRGLHEIRKVAVAHGCRPETINGLSGMGDLTLTCTSTMSRNNRFGILLSQGKSLKEAENEIDMVVEGAYTCKSILQISKELNISMPITQIVYEILYEDLTPKSAVKELMQRAIKEEHL